MSQLHFLKRTELESKIQSQGGRFFTIAFRKMDGSPRKMNGRCGVTKYCRSGKTRQTKNFLMHMYDIVNKGYRIANLGTALLLNAEKKTFIILD